MQTTLTSPDLLMVADRIGLHQTMLGSLAVLAGLKALTATVVSVEQIVARQVIPLLKPSNQHLPPLICKARERTGIVGTAFELRLGITLTHFEPIPFHTFQIWRIQR